jgi:hypothetical protein
MTTFVQSSVLQDLRAVLVTLTEANASGAADHNLAVLTGQK